MVSITDAKANLERLLDSLDDGPVVITRRRRPAAVLLSVAAYEALAGLTAQAKARRRRK